MCGQAMLRFGNIPSSSLESTFVRLPMSQDLCLVAILPYATTGTAPSRTDAKRWHERQQSIERMPLPRLVP